MAAQLIQLNEFRHDGGCAWQALLPSPAGSQSSDAAGVRLFENGVELGPAHCLHRDIREQGSGRFSAYDGQLWFSSSDNSDPTANGREYVALLPAPGQTGELMSAIEQAATLNPDTPETARHQLLSLFAGIVYPGFSLPDLGRRIDRDSAFHAAMHRFFPEGGVAVDRRYALRELARSAVLLDGDFAECGCFSGASAYVMAQILDEAGSDKALHLFDSFAGLSAPGPDEGGHWRAGDLACAEETTRANLAGFPFVRLHPGWIPETFAAVSDRRFALVHIDADLYEPTRDSVHFFWERLVPGGLLICDDYGFTTCPGATRALDEFFADQREPIVNLSAGGALVIKQG